MFVFTRAALVAALAATIAPAAVGAQAKIAFVRSTALLEATPGRAAAESLLTRELAGFEDTAKRMQDSLTTLITAYQKVAPTLTPAQRETREKSIRDLQVTFSRRDSTMRDQAQRRQAELIQPIIGRVRELLDEIRAAEGYTAIIDLEAQGQSILSYDKNLDITERVINRLRTMAPVTATSTAPAATRPAGAPVPAPAGATRPKP